MKSALSKSLLAVFCFSFALSAQTKPIEQGLEPDWDIRPVLKEIAAHAGRLLPVLDQIDPKAWVAKGASDTYVAQWSSVKAQTEALKAEALVLANNPEKLSDALKVYFRMQSLEYMLNSLDSGIRKYQNTALADLLARTAAENGANRNRFQRYIEDLSSDREQQFDIMNHEAQRCRAILVQQHPEPHKTGRK